MKPDLYLINGPLGAGKTTLLKYLLSTSKFAAARVVENEFASQSVDTEQLAHHHGEVKTIAGLCICCSTGSELTDALEELATTSNEPVIIEATGVANSLLLVEKLAAAGLLERYNLRQGLFVLDAAEVAMRPELIEEYHEELAAADVVLLSKTDLCEGEAVVAMRKRLSKLRDGAVETVDQGRIDLAIMNQPSQIVQYYLNHEIADRSGRRDPSYTIIPTHDVEITTEQLRVIWVKFVETYDAARMKGAIRYDGCVWHVEATPVQCQIELSQDEDETLSLVIIGTNAHQITQAIFMEELAR